MPLRTSVHIFHTVIGPERAPKQTHGSVEIAILIFGAAAQCVAYTMVQFVSVFQ